MEIPEKVVERTEANLKVYRAAINLIYETCAYGVDYEKEEAIGRIEFIAGVVDLVIAIVGENKNEISG